MKQLHSWSCFITFLPADYRKCTRILPPWSLSLEFLATETKVVPTFVQFAIDVLGKFLRGLHIGRVDVQRSAVGPAGVSQLHRVLTHIQDVSPEILNLRVLHQVKLAHGHTDGKAWEGQTTEFKLLLLDKTMRLCAISFSFKQC